MVTVPFAFGAIGALVTGWRPRVAVPVLTVVAIVSYFTQQFAPLFGWPEWVENTSIYALYGTPMSTGVEWGGIAALVALGIAGGVLAIAAMRRRDVGR
jgi:putative exporter of polyketide antibiotics